MSAPVPSASTYAVSPAAPTAAGLAPALHALDVALDAPRDGGRDDGSWRWSVRQRMAALRDALADDLEGSDDGWLAARSGGMLRERDALLGRMSSLGPAVLESRDVEQVRRDLKRLLTDVGHYVQRLHDLAYDAVELELGGSE